MGRQIGSLYKEILQRKAARYEKKWMSPPMHDKILSIENKMEKTFPDALEELKGKAAGAGISLETVVLMNSPELIRKEDGCTTVMMKNAQGEAFLSHNEDERGFFNNNTMLVRFIYGDHWIVSYINAEQLIGSCFGFNSYGLVFSSNYLFPNHTDSNEISRYIYERYLTSTKSVADARERLQRMKVASPFSFNVVDTNTNEIYNFEKDIDRVYETEITDRYGRANHFLLKEGEIKSSPSSQFRSGKARESVLAVSKNGLKKEDLRGILDYREEDILRSIMLTGSRRHTLTVANMSYSNSDRSLVVRDYLGHREYSFILNGAEITRPEIRKF